MVCGEKVVSPYTGDGIFARESSVFLGIGSVVDAGILLYLPVAG